MSGTYPNADARPHTGDRVSVDHTGTAILSEDVTGRVRGTRTIPRVDGDECFVEVMYGVRCTVRPFPLDAVTLVDASTPRFDGYDAAGGEA